MNTAKRVSLAIIMFAGYLANPLESEQQDTKINGVFGTKTSDLAFGLALSILIMIVGESTLLL